jgi:2,4-dienoyl-CoA reductase (NADPH2)
MTKSRIQSTIQDYVTCAILAKEAGYDGVELMGSEGYLIHQFLCPKTNMRTDEYGGGSYANRMRFAIEIVREIRSKLPSSFIIVFRLSMLDLVDNASTWEEIVLLAKELEYAGVTILNTGIGWHEARVPTIATLVPRGAFAWVTRNMKNHVTSIPVCTSNRINTPEKVEQILSSGQADLVSMARPFLAKKKLILVLPATKPAWTTCLLGGVRAVWSIQELVMSWNCQISNNCRKELMD